MQGGRRKWKNCGASADCSQPQAPKEVRSAEEQTAPARPWCQLGALPFCLVFANVDEGWVGGSQRHGNRMSGLNSAVLDLSLCGSLGTGIHSAVCEGKHQFTRKALPPSFIRGTFIHFVFYSSVGIWLTSAIADSCLPSPALRVLTPQCLLPDKRHRGQFLFSALTRTLRLVLLSLSPLFVHEALYQN